MARAGRTFPMHNVAPLRAQMGAIFVTPLPPAGAASASAPTPSLSITFPAPGRTLTDTFTRTLSASVGGADTGQTTTIYQGTTTDYAVNGSQLTITMAANQSPILAYNVDPNTLDMLWSYKFDTTSTGALQRMGPCWWVLDAANYYRMAITQTTGGNSNLFVEQQVANVNTTIPMDWGSGLTTATKALVTTQVANQKYWCRTKVQSNGAGSYTFLVKVWKDGDSEPSDTPATSGTNIVGLGTDIGGAAQTHGGVGFRGQSLSGNTNTPTYTIDDLTAVLAPSAASAVPTPSLTITVPAPAPSATGSSPTPTVSITIPVPVSSATGAAGALAAITSSTPPAASASASAPTPALSITLLPGTSSATASVPTVTFSVAGGGTVIAGGSVSANAPTPIVSITANLIPAATATGSVPSPAPTVTVFPNAVGGTASARTPLLIMAMQPADGPLASARTPTVIAANIFFAPSAQAGIPVLSPSGIDPTVIITMPAPPISATASAPAPSAPTLTIVAPPAQATAQTSAFLNVQVTLISSTPVAAISPQTPVVVVTMPVPAAGATASGPLPGVSLSLTSPSAAATGSSAIATLLWTIFPAPSRATASAPTPPSSISDTIVVPLIHSYAFTGASIPITTGYVGWKARPVKPVITPLGLGVTQLSLSFGIRFNVIPAKGTYLRIESIHFHGQQTYGWNGAWNPLSYHQTFLSGLVQTFKYVSSDAIELKVAPDAFGGECFTLGISDEPPFRSTVSILPDTYHRIDLIADCSTFNWTVDWSVDLVRQNRVEREERGDVFPLASGASNWREYVFAADVSEEYNSFEATELEADTEGVYPLA